MKRFSLAIGSITAVGIAVKNMEHLTLSGVFLFGIVLLMSFLFIRAVWKIPEDKQDVVKLPHAKKKIKSKKRTSKKANKRKS
ncbi:TPA: hypothetical protein DIV55_06565 [Patescibacteria group bacterium]|nr:hypothetical protein [Patescibacteria group bacterium]